MHCKGGVFIPNADVHRRGGANRWTCVDMGEGGQKSRKKNCGRPLWMAPKPASRCAAKMERASRCEAGSSQAWEKGKKKWQTLQCGSEKISCTISTMRLKPKRSEENITKYKRKRRRKHRRKSQRGVKKKMAKTEKFGITSSCIGTIERWNKITLTDKPKHRKFRNRKIGSPS